MLFEARIEQRCATLSENPEAKLFYQFRTMARNASCFDDPHRVVLRVTILRLVLSQNAGTTEQDC